MTDAETQHQLGTNLRRQGQACEALGPLEAAVQLAPTNPLFRLDLGATLLGLGRAAAAETIAPAVALVPTLPEARNLLGCALLAAGRTTEAQAEFAEALRLRPGYAAAHDNLGRACRAQGRMAEALRHFQLALGRSPSPSPATHSNFLLATNYADSLPAAEIVARHREWDARHARSLRPGFPPAIAPFAGRRLRIGYVSPDFCQHAVAFFFAPVLAAHDRTRFEIFCYHSGSVRDAVTAQLRAAAEHWRDIAALDDDTAAGLIRRDGIDVLVDLAGHTAGNRLLVFARRPAPAQATWLGYPNTTGLAAMDWRLTDATCLPPGDDARHGPEKLLRLPDVFCCYQPPPDCPPAETPATDRPPTFGSFNNLAKLSPSTIRLWAQLLAAQPAARLLLKSPGANDPETQNFFRAQFASHGVAPERIRFNGEALPMRQHLALYLGCDVALDPLPYNGTTTTCEALLMGVPVVTLAGETHVSRVGASLLRCVGLPEFVATTPAEYVSLATRLAASIPRRAELRARLLTSPLGDTVRFTRNYETAMLEAWQASAAAAAA